MTEQTDPNPTPEPGSEPAASKPDDQLGDAGKKALTEERQARREAERQAREARDRAAELEGAELRRSVAADKGLTAEQAKFLSGDDREAMEARADELLEAFKPDEEDQTRRRPRERLKSGVVSSVEPTDFSKVADKVWRD